MKVGEIRHEARCSACNGAFDAVAYKPSYRESGRAVCDACLYADRTAMSPAASAVQAPEICGGVICIDRRSAKG
ncbi:hypothetical protein CMI37_17530 [Candidatus Pacearchaeota archaeon]|jgi:hypothetical protein|nr:hypothetical protein [Candidatus Pacearchaeota archaeon]